MFKGFIVFILACTFNNVIAQSFNFKDSVVIQAKVWSKNKEKQVKYSNWKPNVSHTIGMIQNFDTTLTDQNIDIYGGSSNLKSKVTGYFRAEKINNRFWFVDPLGNSFLQTAINGIRPGTSKSTIKTLNDHFGNLDNWISDVQKNIKSFGFKPSKDFNSFLIPNEIIANTIPIPTAVKN
jgi:hypothetical protein